jgi:hypothetical protein
MPHRKERRAAEVLGGEPRAKRQRILLLLLALTALTTSISGGLVATAPPAAAAPTGCTAGWMGNGMTYASAYCSSGTGTYNVWIQCRSSVWPYWYSFKESAWYRPGTGPAFVMCNAPSTIVTRGIGLRN